MCWSVNHILVTAVQDWILVLPKCFCSDLFSCILVLLLSCQKNLLSLNYNYVIKFYEYLFLRQIYNTAVSWCILLILNMIDRHFMPIIISLAVLLNVGTSLHLVLCCIVVWTDFVGYSVLLCRYKTVRGFRKYGLNVDERRIPKTIRGRRYTFRPEITSNFYVIFECNKVLESYDGYDGHLFSQL